MANRPSYPKTKGSENAALFSLRLARWQLSRNGLVLSHLSLLDSDEAEMMGYRCRLEALGLFTHHLLVAGIALVAPLKDIACLRHEAGGQMDREDDVVLGLTDIDIIHREIVDHAHGPKCGDGIVILQSVSRFRLHSEMPQFRIISEARKICTPESLPKYTTLLVKRRNSRRAAA
jgi:hypothetical protein